MQSEVLKNSTLAALAVLAWAFVFAQVFNRKHLADTPPPTRMFESQHANARNPQCYLVGSLNTPSVVTFRQMECVFNDGRVTLHPVKP